MTFAICNKQTHPFSITHTFCKSCDLEQFSTTLNKVALAFITPMHVASEWIIHAITPFRANQYTNFSSWYLEMIARIVKIAACVLGIPFILAFFGLSGFLDLAADNLKKKPYTYLAGNKLEEKKDTGSSYTFLSLNTCMLWGCLPISFGGVNPAIYRINQLRDLIKKQNNDFVILQELSFGPALKLWECIQDKYPHGYTRIAAQAWLNMDTSLFVASKYPFVCEPFYFPLPVEGIAKKGVFCFETTNAILMVTHFTAGTAEGDIDLRKKQLREVLERKKQLEEKTGKVIILIGDLNIKRESNTFSDEYSGSKIRENFRDVYKESHPDSNEDTATCTNALTAYAFGKELKEPAWELIDYVLVGKNGRQPVLEVELVKDTINLINPSASLSDHRGLVANINFELQTG